MIEELGFRAADFGLRIYPRRNRGNKVYWRNRVYKVNIGNIGLSLKNQRQLRAGEGGAAISPKKVRRL